MLQLATLPTRGASGALDLLITRAVERQLLGSSTLPKVGSNRLGGHHLQFQSRRAATRLAYRRQLHHGQHKIISDGKIIAVAAGKTKNSWL
jgi:hypothetical protein